MPGRTADWVAVYLKGDFQTVAYLVSVTIRSMYLAVCTKSDSRIRATK
jgi:hypothetical protein